MAAEWERLEEGIVQTLSHEAVSLLKPHLGAERGAPTSASEWGKDLLSPLPEVVTHSDPLSPDTPLNITLRLSFQPAPPDPLQSDAVWPPDPALEAMRQAAIPMQTKEPTMPSPSSTAPGPHPAYPGVPPPPPGVPAAGAGPAPVPALPTRPRPQTNQPQAPGGF